MGKYSDEVKANALRKMMPPMSLSLAEVSRQSGIPSQTLYNWRIKAKNQGNIMPKKSNPDEWSSEEKFRVVLETEALNEHELGEYCRSKGLYKEQIKAWREACMNANSQNDTPLAKQKKRSQSDNKKIKSLEQELKRKEKALAETAALLVLKKKADAIWGDKEDD